MSKNVNRQPFNRAYNYEDGSTIAFDVAAQRDSDIAVDVTQDTLILVYPDGKGGQVSAELDLSKYPPVRGEPTVNNGIVTVEFEEPIQR